MSESVRLGYRLGCHIMDKKPAGTKNVETFSSSSLESLTTIIHRQRFCRRRRHVELAIRPYGRCLVQGMNYYESTLWHFCLVHNALPTATRGFWRVRYWISSTLCKILSIHETVSTMGFEIQASFSRCQCFSSAIFFLLSLLIFHLY
jgi:hypothetical protein